MREDKQYTFYEFFAGGGMARAGLGNSWKCLFANDFDHKKSETYWANWGSDELRVGDVRNLSSSDLPDIADLAWASFPCQDLSLAGSGAGLRGDRSGTFWPFWNLVKELSEEGRAPRVITLENVCGALTSHNGKDFRILCDALVDAQYRVGAIVIDAAHFVPQSRPRLFVVGIHKDTYLPSESIRSTAMMPFHTKALQSAYNRLSEKTQAQWLWLNLALPQERTSALVDILDVDIEDGDWHSKEETDRLLSMMSELHLEKVRSSSETGRLTVGTVYKRTRKDEYGRKVQRAEVRFDNVAGCLRTPAGGSSRQIIMTVCGEAIRSRLMTSRETARLMGLPDSYYLPHNYNEAYHLTGDGVAVPVVRYLAQNLIEPILSGQSADKIVAA